MSISTSSESESIPNITVTDYANENGLDVAFVLEEIAKGVRNGFHKGGVWYITASSTNNSQQTIHSNEETKKKKGNTSGGIIGLIDGIIGLSVVLFIAYLFFSSDVGGNRYKPDVGGNRYKPGECQKVYVPGDSRPTCESGLLTFSTSTSSRSASSRSTSSGPKVESEKELNCLMRLVIERKQGKNSMSDGGIATLCDQLF